MKTKFVLLLIMVCIGCKRNNALTFETLSVLSKSCDTCSTVSIEIPNALDKTPIGKTINMALREEIIVLLNFDEESDAQNIEEAIDGFVTEHKQLNEKFQGGVIPWEAKINGTITFENEQLITIKLKSYIFSGGAHGYESTRFLNFNKVKGSELERDALFKNEEDFKTYAEIQFRKQEGIPTKASINSTGFMFETETFYSPKNIGYTDKGLRLFYKPYEIASYADGPITLTLPYNEVNSFLSFPIAL